MSGKSQGNLNFFKVRELSGNFTMCQGNLELLANVSELSGNFENTRFKSNYFVNFCTSHQCFGGSLTLGSIQKSDWCLVVINDYKF